MNYNEDDNIIHFAGCVIVDDYERVLLMHRAGDPGRWELPSGQAEPEETPELASMREVASELGISVHLKRKLGSESLEQNGEVHMYHWFLAEIIGGEPEILSPATFDDHDYFEIEDLLSLSLSPDMEMLSTKLFYGELTLDDEIVES